MYERRRFARKAIQVPVNVSTRVRRDRAGIIRDLSASGVLFHSRSRFEVGERITMLFRIAEQPSSAAGYVVRAAADDAFSSPFPFLTAVCFDAPLLDLPLDAQPCSDADPDTDVDGEVGGGAS